jgi:hypothetical protein
MAQQLLTRRDSQEFRVLFADNRNNPLSTCWGKSDSVLGQPLEPPPSPLGTQKQRIVLRQNATSCLARTLRRWYLKVPVTFPPSDQPRRQQRFAKVSGSPTRNAAKYFARPTFHFSAQSARVRRSSSHAPPVAVVAHGHRTHCILRRQAQNRERRNSTLGPPAMATAFRPSGLAKLVASHNRPRSVNSPRGKSGEKTSPRRSRFRQSRIFVPYATDGGSSSEACAKTTFGSCKSTCAKTAANTFHSSPA